MSTNFARIEADREFKETNTSEPVCIECHKQIIDSDIFWKHRAFEDQPFHVHCAISSGNAVVCKEPDRVHVIDIRHAEEFDGDPCCEEEYCRRIEEKYAIRVYERIFDPDTWKTTIFAPTSPAIERSQADPTQSKGA